MRISQFTPRLPPADITVKPQVYKCDPEVSLHHDDLYSRAWEYDFEQPIFDAEIDKPAPPNLQEIPHVCVPQSSSPAQTRSVT